MSVLKSHKMGLKCPQNTWTTLIYLQLWQRLTIIAGLSLISIPTLLSNVAAILSIFRTNQRNNFFCVLVLFLSLSDCMFALITQTASCIIIYEPNINCIFKIITQFWTFLFANLSDCIIIATSLERLFSINRLQPANLNVSRKRIYIVGSICVVLALQTALMYTIFTVRKLFLLIVCISYATLYNRVLLHFTKTVSLKHKNYSARSDTQAQHTPVYLLSTAKVIKRVLTAFFIAYLPYTVVSLYWSYGVKSAKSEHINWICYGIYLASLLTYFNTTMNALIFISGNQKCKRYLKDQWRRTRIMNNTSS